MATWWSSRPTGINKTGSDRMVPISQAVTALVEGISGSPPGRTPRSLNQKTRRFTWSIAGSPGFPETRRARRVIGVVCRAEDRFDDLIGRLFRWNRAGHLFCPEESQTGDWSSFEGRQKFSESTISAEIWKETISFRDPQHKQDVFDLLSKWEEKPRHSMMNDNCNRRGSMLLKGKWRPRRITTIG